MRLFIDSQFSETMPVPQFYFVWGNEPRGMVSTGRYDDNEVYQETGVILRESAKEMGLKFHNPNA